MARRAKQLEFVIRQHGGRRDGAGRKAAGRRPNVPHRPRAPHARHAPVHVTLRTATLPASLRVPSVFAVVRTALGKASRDAFRVIAFSVQRNHLHLVVEAEAGTALSRGVQGLAIRIARAVNRVLGRRGRVWGERFHARDLRTPREVRNALVYVLQNHRKHGDAGARFDACSSARWFEGWKVRLRGPWSSAPVVTARTWLGRWGWRRHGLLDPQERPSGPRYGRPHQAESAPPPP
jgi:putative transposase